ncbi:M23 family metallopeptidase [Paenibacillus sp. YYML68]|uniref:M23 family metallopeptidase n=1 Tax=Paenibacillus sp. YYML68 TaxID=2909250 RepID=UPI002490FA9B|nr:M23 family metallopeptidase [Paenibacillus sp. YYML68]
MNIRNNVRERRYEKIRRLQQQAWRQGRGEPRLTSSDLLGREELYDDAGRYTPPWHGGTPSTHYGEADDSRTPYSMQPPDPEEEWRRKYERDWSGFGRSDSYDPARGQQPPTDRTSRFAVKLLLSTLLFAGVWAMYQSEHPLAERGKQLVTASLNEPMDTAALTAWYERHFGTIPSILPAIQSTRHQEAEKVAVVPKHYFSPIEGKLLAPFSTELGGVLMEAEAGKPVSAVDTGLVVYAGDKDDTGYTIVLRHTDGMESVYGLIEPGTLQLNDWVKGGETVGTIAKPKSEKSAGTLFFSVTKAGKPVDPADVIPFD